MNAWIALNYRQGLRVKTVVIFCFCLLGSRLPVHAHKPSDSYLSQRVDGAKVTGQWDVALRDLEYAIGLDANEDGTVTWDELRARRKELENYLAERVHVRLDGAEGAVNVTELHVEQHTDGTYAVLRFDEEGLAAASWLEVEYRALFDLDAQHRGLMQLASAGQTQTAIFSPDNPIQRFELSAPRAWRQLLSFAWEGVWHIWIGYDHILFLLALLLPAVLQREHQGWRGVDRFKPAFVNVLKIVTAFTVAHSVTLSLATLGIVRLPSRWVESAIAASVVLAALNNIRPLFHGRAWLMAFGFGLIHGFGFANVLLDLGLAAGVLARALVGFNAGVEAGQLAIVAVFLPLAYGARRSWFYRGLTLKFGSTGILLLAAVWMSERMFNFKVLPF